MIDINTLLSGVIPETLEDKTAAASQLVHIARRIIPVTSLLIASARRDHFKGQIADWVAWCQDNFALDASDRDHRRAIGEMLLDVRDNQKLYQRLFLLDKEKLISVTRIPQTQLPAFMTDNNVEKMTREEVRTAVKIWLNEEPKEKPVQTELPGFEKIVESVLSLQPGVLIDSINSDCIAIQSFEAGIGLFGAALEYKKNAEIPDVEFLQATKKMLLDEVAEIEAAIAKTTKL